MFALILFCRKNSHFFLGALLLIILWGGPVTRTVQGKTSLNDREMGDVYRADAYGSKLEFNNGSLAQEAETADRTQTGLMEVVQESGATFVGVPAGKPQAYSWSPNSSRVEYEVFIPQAGEYRLDAWVLAQTNTSDSFYIGVDGNVASSNAWHLGQSSNIVKRSFSHSILNMSAGSHTLKFYHRESAALLDRFELVPVNVTGPIITPTSSAPNTPIPTSPHATPTPISGGSPNGALAQEAETADRVQTNLMAVVQENGATLVGVPANESSEYTWTQNSDRIEYQVFIPQDGEYRLDAWVLAKTNTSDSFYIGVDGNVASSNAWHLGQSSNIVKRSFSHSILNMSAGTHTLKFYHRESGALLDRFELVLVNGTGPIATATSSAPNTPIPTSPPATPTPINGGPSNGALAQEAETADRVQTELMAVVQENGATLVGVPADEDPAYTWSPNSNRVEYEVFIPQAGEYRLDAWVLAKTNSSDSFYIGVDGNVASSNAWHFGGPTPPDAPRLEIIKGSFTHNILNLSAGTHTLKFYHRESGAFLDRFELVPVNVTGPVPPTATNVPPTATNVPPTATNVLPTATNVPPAATNVPPTATNVPATATNVPATATNVPPTATNVPPTATYSPPSTGGDEQLAPTPICTANCGEWSVKKTFTGGGDLGKIVPIHAILMANGDVMTYGTHFGPSPDPRKFLSVIQGGYTVSIYEPKTDKIFSFETPLTPTPGPESSDPDNGFETSNIFCSIQTTNPINSDVIIAGGDDGEKDNFSVLDNPGRNNGTNATNFYSIYDKDDNFQLDRDGSTFRSGNSMTYPRWYATMTTLSNGEILIQGGSQNSGKVAGSGTPPNFSAVNEIYSPYNSQWIAKTGSATTNGNRQIFKNNGWYYPRAFVAPDGNVFGIAEKQLYVTSKSGNEVKTIENENFNTHGGFTSTSVVYDAKPDVMRIMHIGGLSFQAGNAYDSTGGFDLTELPDITLLEPAFIGTNRTTLIKVNGDSTKIDVEAGPSMRFPRSWADSTLLPTGQILVTGGSYAREIQIKAEAPASKIPFKDSDGIAYHAELYTPAGENVSKDEESGLYISSISGNEGTWQTMAPSAEPRLYHSTAILLPDGRVFTGGGGSPGYYNTLQDFVASSEKYTGGCSRKKEQAVNAAIEAAKTLAEQKGEDWQKKYIAPSLNCVNETNYEIYSPSYMKANKRPTITLAKDHFNLEGIPFIYNAIESFDHVGEGLALGESKIAATVVFPNNKSSTERRFAMIKTGSVTHSFNNEQRYVRLSHIEPSKETGPEYQLIIPDRKTAPPGYYMVFALEKVGGQWIPSEAAMLQVKASVQIQIKGTDKCFAINSTPDNDEGYPSDGSVGQDIQIWDCNGNGPQQFKFGGITKLPDGTAHTSLINPSKQSVESPTHKCIEKDDRDEDYDVNVAHLWHCNGAEGQQWTLKKVHVNAMGENVYKLKKKDAGTIYYSCATPLSSAEEAKTPENYDNIGFLNCSLDNEPFQLIVFK